MHGTIEKAIKQAEIDRQEREVLDESIRIVQESLKASEEKSEGLEQDLLKTRDARKQLEGTTLFALIEVYSIFITYFS